MQSIESPKINVHTYQNKLCRLLNIKYLTFMYKHNTMYYLLKIKINDVLFSMHYDAPVFIFIFNIKTLINLTKYVSILRYKTVLQLY